ncbi:hypothetical protein AYI69_g10410, partial [Smittium culicis]
MENILQHVKELN